MVQVILRVGLLAAALAVAGCLELGPNLTGVSGSGSLSDPLVLPAENQTGVEQGIEDYLEFDGHWTFGYKGIEILVSGSKIAEIGDLIYDTRTDTWFADVDGEQFKLTDNAGTYESADCGGTGTCVELFIFDNDPLTSQYGTFGLIAEDDGVNVSLGALFYGLRTPSEDMPTTGTATYNGEFAGAVALSDGTLVDIASTAALDVDFGNGTVDFSSTGAGFTIDAAATISGNSYSGTSVTASYTSGTTIDFTSDGLFIGEFYGPAANETAGAVGAVSDNGDAIGGAFWAAK